MTDLAPNFPHAVARLRTARLLRSTRPFLARGGVKGERCEGCRLRPSHCMCALRPLLPTHAGVCLLMHDAEPLKPSNTGWLIADVVQDTYAFGWSRTEVDPHLVKLLQDPKWQPYVVFPSEYVTEPERVIHALPSRTLPAGSATETEVAGQAAEHEQEQAADAVADQSTHKRPLFVLLDATWSEARKMFRKSPYLDGLQVLGLRPEQLSRYRLRRSKRDDHLCTIEVAALCMELSAHPKDAHAAAVLERYLAIYTHHYLQAKQQQAPDLTSADHVALKHLLSA